MKKYGTTGDVNAFEYGGGLVFDKGNGPEWWVWDEPDEGGDLLVYRVSVPEDVLEYYNWADVDAVARSTGESVMDIKRRGSSKNPLNRVRAMESIAGHYGIMEFDSEPQEYTEERLREILEEEE